MADRRRSEDPEGSLLKGHGAHKGLLVYAENELYRKTSPAHTSVGDLPRIMRRKKETIRMKDSTSF